MDIVIHDFTLSIFLASSPTVAVSLLLYFGQLFLCKFVFLQDRGAYLALNNRFVFSAQIETI